MDIEKVRELIALMNEHDLGEIEMETDAGKIRLRKRTAAAPTLITHAPVAHATVAPHPKPAAEPSRTAKDADLAEIVSPMVGTFYHANSPDADPYVEVGSAVEPEAVVCIIEAMKVMNEIKAEVEGEIVEILVKNGDPVEYGQPLFRVKLTKRGEGGAEKA